ncbi:unnamed protein product [Clonostachys rosea f. rosea IK726]|uniref:Uncharacterized protein n=1 Tax=Clonostachys rosea f. rosea IK726 TaxID=1349383 RepID=A0ACA9U6R0_BIOOC|nr:unnamed protein product [Clonostachys rosea f. rosea IK726]
MRPAYALLAVLSTSAYAAPVVERTSVGNGNNGIPNGSKNLLDYLGGLGDYIQKINKALPVSIDVDLPILPGKRDNSEGWINSQDDIANYIDRLQEYIHKIIASLPDGGTKLDLSELGLSKRTWGNGYHRGWGNWNKNDNPNGGNGQGGNNQGGNGQNQNNSGQSPNPWQNFNWDNVDLSNLNGNFRDLLKKIGINVNVPGNGGLSLDLGGCKHSLNYPRRVLVF